MSLVSGLPFCGYSAPCLVSFQWTALGILPFWTVINNAALNNQASVSVDICESLLNICLGMKLASRMLCYSHQPYIRL